MQNLDHTLGVSLRSLTVFSWWDIRNQGFLDFTLDPAEVNGYLYPYIHELHVLGIIKQDPKLPVDKILPPPSPWPKSSIFDADEEKSKVRSFSLTLVAYLESDQTPSFFFFEFLNFILFTFLYSRFLFVVHFIHISVYISIPISQFITPPQIPSFRDSPAMSPDPEPKCGRVWGGGF